MRRPRPGRRLALWASVLLVLPALLAAAPQGAGPADAALAAITLSLQAGPVAIEPEWTPADPERVSVTPGRTGEFRITVKGAGESKLKLASGGIARELVVKGEAARQRRHPGPDRSVVGPIAEGAGVGQLGPLREELKWVALGLRWSSPSWRASRAPGTNRS